MTKSEFQEVMGMLSKHKSTAETVARKVKNHFPEKKSEEYITAEDFYSRAKIHFDMILGKSRASLQEGKKIEITEEDDNQVKEDINKLVEYSNSLFVFKASAIAIPVGLILPSLITIFGAITDIYLKIKREERKKLLDELEKYRWKHFDEI